MRYSKSSVEGIGAVAAIGGIGLGGGGVGGGGGGVGGGGGGGGGGVGGVGGGVGGVGGDGGGGDVGRLGGGGDGLGDVENIPIHVTSTLAQAKKQLLSLKKQSVRDAKTDKEREKAKQHKLLARQAVLPVANINLPGHCFILKSSIVVLKHLDKSKQVLEGAEGVVKLIVKECAEYGDAHMGRATRSQATPHHHPCQPAQRTQVQAK